MNSNLRLIRRVQGPLGSLRLYRHARVGLVEIVELHEGTTQVLELRRHENEVLPELLAYADEVQKGVAAFDSKAAKRARRIRSRRLGGG
jgi:hypothetical protein